MTDVIGRPTKYNQGVIDRASDYIENFSSYGDVVPTVSGMACELGLHRDTLYDWAKDPEKRDFSDIFNKLMQFQERSLINGGLAGGYNPAVTKMMLTKHGYSDSQQITQTTTHSIEKSLAQQLADGSKE